MIDLRVTLKALAIAIPFLYVTSASAQDVLSRDAGELLDRLSTLTAEEEAVEANRLAAEIQERWTHSGSAAIDLLLTRGQDAIAEGDYVRAITHLTALTDHAPDFAEGWNQRATAFFLMDRYGEAMSDIEQVLILEPRHFGALTGLGIILESLGEPKAALRAFERAQDIHPADDNINGAVERLGTQTGERTL